MAFDWLRVKRLTPVAPTPEAITILLGNINCYNANCAMASDWLAVQRIANQKL